MAPCSDQSLCEQQALQGVLLRGGFSPAETCHTKYWCLEASADLLDVEEGKSEQKEHCKDEPCCKDEEREK